MESYADDLWQNLLTSGQATEAKDPAELTWWAAGAIDVEAGHKLELLATENSRLTCYSLLFKNRPQMKLEAENMQEMAWEYQ